MLIAAALAVMAIGWILSGQLGPVAGDAPAPANALRQEAATPLASVRVARLRAQARDRLVVVSGHTEASRQVDVRAETYGRIVEIRVEKGDIVERGQILGRIDIAERQARLAEAEALLRQRDIEYTAASRHLSSSWVNRKSMAQVLLKRPWASDACGPWGCLHVPV